MPDDSYTYPSYGPMSTPFWRTVSTITDENAGIRGGRNYDDNVRDYERQTAARQLRQGMSPGEIIAGLYGATGGIANYSQEPQDIQLPAETPAGKRSQAARYAAIHGLKQARPAKD